MKKKLYLIMETFPYGRGEKTFILPELPKLQERFEVTIISTATPENYKNNELVTKLDENIKVYWQDCTVGRFEFIKWFVKFWMKRECRMEVQYIIKARKMIWARIRKSIAYYATAEHIYNNIMKAGIIDENEEGIYYSFWYHERVLAMLLHREEHPNLKVVARAHGYDLYDERVRDTQWQPFKKVMDRKIDHVIFISDYGYDYYLEHYAQDKIRTDKYAIFRLGVTAKPYCSNRAKHKPMLLVSCSNVIPLKRIDYIIHALAKIYDYEIRWVHFGTGYEQENIEGLARKLLVGKENVTFEFKGHLPNDEIMAYYEKEMPDCFITTSSTEGSPVSIQEALAFGMPVIATAVGGIPEMINGNGVLLDANPTIEDVIKAISLIAHLSEEEYTRFCAKSHQIWIEKFNQEENVRHFIDYLD